MNFGIVKTGAEQLGKFFVKNSPAILTGLGVGGVVTTTVMAIGATPKAMDLIALEQDRRKEEASREGPNWVAKPITKMDQIKLVWKCYIPTVLMGMSTIGCIIGANSINSQRIGALTGLYSLAETSLREYQNKVVEVLGEKKEAKIRDEMSQDRLDKDPVTNKTVILTGKGNTLCYDSLSGRYFKSDIDTIKKAQNEFNQRMISNDGYRPLNEFYDSIGLEPTELGSSLGWETLYGLLEVKFSSKIATNDEPCIVLEYRIGPKQV